MPIPGPLGPAGHRGPQGPPGPKNPWTRWDYIRYKTSLWWTNFYWEILPGTTIIVHCDDEYLDAIIGNWLEQNIGYRGILWIMEVSWDDDFNYLVVNVKFLRRNNAVQFALIFG